MISHRGGRGRARALGTPRGAPSAYRGRGRGRGGAPGGAASGAVHHHASPAAGGPGARGAHGARGSAAQARDRGRGRGAGGAAAIDRVIGQFLSTTAQPAGSSGSSPQKAAKSYRMQAQAVIAAVDAEGGLRLTLLPAEAHRLGLFPSIKITMRTASLSTAFATASVGDIVSVVLAPDKHHSDQLFAHEGQLAQCKYVDGLQYCQTLKQRLQDPAQQSDVLHQVTECTAPLIAALQQWKNPSDLARGAFEVCCILKLGHSTCGVADDSAVTALVRLVDQEQLWARLLNEPTLALDSLCMGSNSRSALCDALRICCRHSVARQCFQLAQRVISSWQPTWPETVAQFSCSLLEAARQHLSALAQAAQVGAAFSDTTSITTLTASRDEVLFVPSSVDQSISADIWAMQLAPLVKEIGQSYDTADAYLNAQYHVLRAEAYADLCGALQALRHGHDVGRGVFVYQRVRALQLVTQSFVGHVLLEFSMQEYGRTYDWGTSNRLMHGNLLGIVLRGASIDATVWATVSYRELPLLRQCRVGVTFLNEYNEMAEQDIIMLLLDPSIMAVMIESPVYFLSVAPAMKRLRQHSEHSLPFGQEIVHLARSSPQQALRLRSTPLDMQCLLPAPASLRPTTIDGVLQHLQAGNTICDASQAAAISAALNDKIALIQGPPGTGKTFVAKLLIRLLMSMPEQSLGPSGGRILVLAYKNHALDQFVSGLLPYFQSTMVRLGGKMDPDSPAAAVHISRVTRGTTSQPSQSRAFAEIASKAEETEARLRQLSTNFTASPEFSLPIFVQYATPMQLVSLLLGPQSQSLAADVMHLTEDADSDSESADTKHEPSDDIPSTPATGGDDQAGDEFVVGKRGKAYKHLSPAQLRQLATELKRILEGVDRRPADAADDQSEDSVDRWAALQQNKMLAARLKEQFKAWRPHPKAMEAVVAPADGVGAAAPTSTKPVTQQQSRSTATDGKQPDGQPPAADEDSESEDDNEDNMQRLMDVGDADRMQRRRKGPQQQQQQQQQQGRGGDNERPLININIADDDPAAICNRRLLVEPATGVSNVFHLSNNAKAAMAVHMLQQFAIDQRQEMFQLWQTHRKFEEALKLLRVHKQTEALQSKRLVFMTVSGACLNAELLDAIQPAVVLVEEAAEVMESQLLGALPTSVRQLIMIGDHKQLPPTTNCYPVRLHCKSEVSMFERLWQTPAASCVTLNTQARMLDALADFVRLPGLYDVYNTNTALVNRNPRVPSLARSMYFIDCRFDESSSTGMSKTNHQEAQYLVACLQRLLDLGGLQPQQVSVLAAYAGQVSVLRTIIRQRMHKDTIPHIRVCTIDQFQGDENVVVMVSLVRSTSLGYLKKQNRMCVALTRAKSAVIVFGNQQLLARADHWAHALSVFARNRALLNAMEFVCPRHSASPVPFQPHQASPTCQLTCSSLLHCGHPCTLKCHAGDHSKCKLPCTQVMACGHTCASNCHNTDAKAAGVHCCTKLCGKDLPCGHVCTGLCHAATTSVHRPCDGPCRRLAPCGHPCPLRCCDVCVDKANCKACQAAAKLQAEAERTAQMAAVNAAVDQIHLQLAALQESKDAGFYLEALDAADPECVSVTTQVLSTVSPIHQFGLSIKSISRIVNPALERRCCVARASMYAPQHAPSRKFHGTNADAADAIAREGFRLPTKTGMFGCGVYFASDSSKSAQQLYTQDTLLVCDVWFGQVKIVTTADYSLHDPARRAAERYDSIYAPRNSKATGGVIHDEYALFDPALALPRYMVKFVRTGAPLLPSLQGTAMPQFAMTDVSPDTVSLGSTEDLHFRMAESQYLRMTASWSTQPKVTKVTIISNAELQAVYQQTKQWMETSGIPTTEEFVFHGTAGDNFEKIAKQGFKVGGRDGHGVAHGTVLGTGVYSSTVPDVAAGYSAGVRKLLMVKVLPGAAGGRQPAGSVLWNTAAQHYRHGNVLVLYMAQQCLPMYIVHF